MRGRRPRRTYYSEDHGHLISPCLCKGTIAYVHEDCLQEWRYTNPKSENYIRCSNCKYEYKFQRMTWAKRLRSPVLSLLLTFFICITTVFLLGFIADPILDLWFDPVGTIADKVTSSGSAADEEWAAILEKMKAEESWLEHFLKGLFSFGLLGFVKAFLAMTPWQWWNLRTSGVIGGTGRRLGTGRDRMENMNLALVLIGVVTFFWVSLRRETRTT